MKQILDFVLADENFKIFMTSVISILVIIFNKPIVKIILAILLKFTFKINIELKKKMTKASEKPLRVLLTALSLFVLLMALNTEFSFMDKKILIRLYSSFNFLVIVKLVYNLSDMNSVVVDRVEEKFNYSFDRTVMALLSRTIKILIVLIGAAAIAKVWGYNLNSLVAMVGVFSAVIGLAAKDYLTNVIGGIIIATEKPFSIGDYIETGECVGIVEDITFRTTKIRTFEKAVLSIPNSTLSNDAITNYSKRDMRRARFTVGISYETPIDKIEVVVDKIRNMLLKNEDVDNESLICQFDEFGDSSLNIFLNFYINKSELEEYYKVKEEINLEIMKILSADDVEIAFPSRTLYVKNLDK